MSPNGGGLPEGVLLEAIDNEFGSFENFKLNFPKLLQHSLAQVGLGFVQQRWFC